jgi:predicted nucleic acid-binding protein
MNLLTLDSCVIIASLLVKEPRHLEALDIVNKIKTGIFRAVMPYSVLVEVVAAIRRRTGSESLAIEIKKSLKSMRNVSFVVLDEESANEAARIAARTGLRGIDALVVQIAKEFRARLVTFDNEMISKSVNIVMHSQILFFRFLCLNNISMLQS